MVSVLTFGPWPFSDFHQMLCQAYSLPPEQLSQLKELYDRITNPSGFGPFGATTVSDTIEEESDETESVKMTAEQFSVLARSFGVHLGTLKVQDLIAEVDIGPHAGQGTLDFQVGYQLKALWAD